MAVTGKEKLYVTSGGGFRDVSVQEVADFAAAEAGDVVSVNGVQPNEQGEVTLTSVEVGAVELVTTPFILYGTGGSGVPLQLGWSANPTQTMALRGVDGVLAVGSPTAGDHATPKNYTDAGDNQRVSKVASPFIVYGTNGSSVDIAVTYAQAATVNTLAYREAGGTLSVGTPTATGHAATKAYVDGLTAAATTSVNGTVKLADFQANSAAADVATLVTDFNALLAKLRSKVMAAS